MNKTALFIGLGIVLTSCNLFTDPVRKSAEAYLMKNINDPSSYEFVSLVPTDTITYLDNIVGIWEFHQKLLSNSREDYSTSRSNVNIMRERIREEEMGSKSYENYLPVDITYWEESSKEYLKKYYADSILVAGIDSIRAALGDGVNEVACYEYAFTYRAKNAMGALTLNRALLQITPENKVIIVAETPDERIGYPNSFPGYLELVQRKY